MSRPKYTRRDTNHKDIVEGCRELGMVVWDLADLGGKVLDTIVFWRGKAIPVEIKSPGKEDDLTLDERESISELEAIGVKYVIAVSVEDVIKAFE